MGENIFEKPCLLFGLSVSFYSASAKNFHFGASLFKILGPFPLHKVCYSRKRCLFRLKRSSRAVQIIKCDNHAHLFSKDGSMISSYFNILIILQY